MFLNVFNIHKNFMEHIQGKKISKLYRNKYDSFCIVHIGMIQIGTVSLKYHFSYVVKTTINMHTVAEFVGGKYSDNHLSNMRNKTFYLNCS